MIQNKTGPFSYVTTPVAPAINFHMFSPSGDQSRLTPAISAAQTEVNAEQLKKLFRAAKKA